MTGPATQTLGVVRRRQGSACASRPSLMMTLALAGVAMVLAVRLAWRGSSRRGRHEERGNPLPRDLLSVLAHELRTPLNAIVGWTHVLQSGQADEAVTATALRSIASSAQTQRRLIEDIVDAMRAQEDAIPVRMEIIDLRSPLRNAVDAIRPSADSAQLSVSLALPPTRCDVTGDGERLQQAFGNVLANAVKFTPEGGIQVSLVRRHNDYEVRITDTGKGIDASFLPLVFRRFEQAERTGHRNDGLGLGLAICRDLIKQHHGWIGVDSRGRGQGTTVIVSLPVDIATHTLNREPTMGDLSS